MSKRGNTSIDPNALVAQFKTLRINEKLITDRKLQEVLNSTDIQLLGTLQTSPMPTLGDKVSAIQTTLMNQFIDAFSVFISSGGKVFFVNADLSETEILSVKETGFKGEKKRIGFYDIKGQLTPGQNVKKVHFQYKGTEVIVPAVVKDDIGSKLPFE